MRPTNSHLEYAHGSASSVQSADAAWKTSQGLQLPLVRDSSDESRISVESRALWVRRIAEFSLAHRASWYSQLTCLTPSLLITCREEAIAALKDGEEQLKVLQRQAAISMLYPSARSVME
jgi:hypothetical protein